jgi:hypothetical protein
MAAVKGQDQGTLVAQSEANWQYAAAAAEAQRRAWAFSAAIPKKQPFPADRERAVGFSGREPFERPPSLQRRPPT